MRIYPNIQIGEVLVGGKTEKDAYQLLTRSYQIPENITINLSGNNNPLSINTREIDAHYNIEEALHRAYKTGRSGNLQIDLATIFLSIFNKKEIPLVLSVNEDKVHEIVESHNTASPTKPIDPSFHYTSGELKLQQGEIGEYIDAAKLITTLKNAIAKRNTNINLELSKRDPTLTKEQEELQYERMAQITPLSLKVFVDDFSLDVTKEDLVSLFSPTGTYSNDNIENFLDRLEKQVNRDAQNPVFQFENNRVKEFAPAKDGLTVNRIQTKQAIIQALMKMEETHEVQSVEINVSKVSPLSQTKDVNDLGITELIGKGTSHFSGSIPSRLFNVALASSRINGVLVAPGETFSFAKAVGDVSKLTGYKEAYIIQAGHTVLGDGGGVCQVSTTLFRAIMNAGLPIVERHPHAYRVGYYEQDSGPGLDATVYVPSVDFKFKNDTANYVLIQTHVDTKNASAEFDIYGTRDGRKAEISKPVISDVIRPADDLYIDDPTQPTGKVQQIEHRANGAKVSFNYTVTKDGAEIFKKTFISVYQPWQAVYMRGTGPVQ